MYAPFGPEYQARQDEEQLRLLEIFYYVMGALTALCGCAGIFHFTIGLMLVANPAAMTGKGNAPPAGMGLLFAMVGGAVIVIGWTVGLLTAYAGKCIKRRTAYTFILVMAGICCLHAPLGTALGVFTFLVMTRPSVRAIFGQVVPGITPPQAEVPKESNS